MESFTNRVIPDPDGCVKQPILALLTSGLIHPAPGFVPYPVTKHASFNDNKLPVTPYNIGAFASYEV